jgi:hypothetical protein
VSQQRTQPPERQAIIQPGSKPFSREKFGGGAVRVFDRAKPRDRREDAASQGRVDDLHIEKRNFSRVRMTCIAACGIEGETLDIADEAC